MSNRSILEKLIQDINIYTKTKQDRSDFASIFMEAIESLEDVPFSVIDEARDWQYKIETENSVDQESHEKRNSKLLANLSLWVKRLMSSYG